MKVPFDTDLSRFSDADLLATMAFLRRAWCKPWLWPQVVPAYIAIRYELEYRRAAA